jgi:hypothetical protein
VTAHGDALRAAVTASRGRLDPDPGPDAGLVFDEYVPPFIDWSTFWDRDRPADPWLLEPILARGRGHAITATAKAGKSLLMLWIAVQLATGPDPVVVVYVDYEMGSEDLEDRLVDLGCGPTTDLGRLLYWQFPRVRQLDTDLGGLEFVAHVDRVADAFPDHHVVVVLDTYSRAVGGAENDSDTTRAFYTNTAVHLKARGHTWVRLDHVGHADKSRSRGSSAKTEDVDVVWNLRRADRGFVLETHGYARMGWVPDRVTVGMLTDPISFDLGVELWPAGTAALADQLDALGVPADTTVNAARVALRQAGLTAANHVLAKAVKYRKTPRNADGTPRAGRDGAAHGTGGTHR